MLCDVSCDDDKMQNVGTVAVGVLAWRRHLSPVSTFRCMFGHLVSPSPSTITSPPAARGWKVLQKAPAHVLLQNLPRVVLVSLPRSQSCQRVGAWRRAGHDAG